MFFGIGFDKVLMIQKHTNRIHVALYTLPKKHCVVLSRSLLKVHLHTTVQVTAGDFILSGTKNEFKSDPSPLPPPAPTSTPHTPPSPTQPLTSLNLFVNLKLGTCSGNATVRPTYSITGTEVIILYSKCNCLFFPF